MGLVMKHKRIAVFSNAWSNEFINKVLEGIRRGAKEDGVDIFFFGTYIYSFDEAAQNKCQLSIFHLPKPEDFDGAIMFTNTFNLHDEQDRICALFQKTGIPMVSTEIRIPGMGYVGTENYSGVHELATHLIEAHGVKEIIYLAGIEGNEESEIRQRALEDALSEHGLKLQGILQGDYGFYTASKTMISFLDEGRKLPEAFVCANDHMALGIASVLQDRGYNIPEDVIVTGFDQVSEALAAFPMIATVSRGWETLGDQAYGKLKAMINGTPEPEGAELKSHFTPSESCGCKPKNAAIRKRLETVRRGYTNSVNSNMLDIFFNKLRIELAGVENKADFYETAKENFESLNLIAQNFTICTEPEFFEIEDREYPKRVRGYSSNMDVIYEMKDGKTVPQYTFDSASIVPGYHHEAGESNLYIVFPLHNLEFIIGYLIITNDTTFLYDGRLKRYISGLNSLFVTMRQYIFAQRLNKKLREIYRTDFLSGMYNRTGCDEVIYEHISKLRSEGIAGMLLFVDIDNMKLINDRHGHLNGDVAIKATADALKHCLPGDWLFGRYGGDEFIAVGQAQVITDLEQTREELARGIREYFDTLNLSFRLSASVGYTIIEPDDEGDISEFIKRADEAMYEEKKRAHERMAREDKDIC